MKPSRPERIELGKITFVTDSTAFGGGGGGVCDCVCGCVCANECTVRCVPGSCIHGGAVSSPRPQKNIERLRLSSLKTNRAT